MRRLVTRLVLSHLFVAVVAAATTFVLVRAMAPQLFDEQLRAGPGAGPGTMGRGAGRTLREQFADAVDSSLAVGALVAVLVATLVGAVAAYRLTRPLAALAGATRELAQGRYAVAVPTPGTSELDALAADVRVLAGTLAETEARRTRLLADVAHEMRTPLTVIDGYVEGMVDGLLPTDAESMDRVAAETRRLRRLADDLSALSRAQEGRLGLVCRHLDLGDVVGPAAERLRPQAQDAGVTLVVTPAPARILVNLDPERIAQVVTNLLGNALRSTPPGGRVTVEVDSPGPGTARVRVSDTGEGLAAVEVERIFERFYRVPGRARDRTGGDSGSGIGLTISREIAHAHGGTLTAASDGLGRGATFSLTLPTIPPP